MNPLDPNSEYYRRCRNCGTEFMSDHLSREFCDNNNKCHDAFHRRNKKYAKLCEPVEYPPIPPQKSVSPELMVGLNKNLDILRKYPIGWTNYWIKAEELENQNFDFNAYTTRFLSNNASNSFFLEFGPYVMNRETKNYFIIKHKQK